MCGAALFGLEGVAQGALAKTRIELGLYGFGLVADDQDDALGRERLREVDGMRSEWDSADGMENFGKLRTHARSLACGEDQDVEIVGRQAKAPLARKGDDCGGLGF